MPRVLEQAKEPSELPSNHIDLFLEQSSAAATKLASERLRTVPGTYDLLQCHNSTSQLLLLASFLQFSASFQFPSCNPSFT